MENVMQAQPVFNETPSGIEPGAVKPETAAS